MKNKPSVAGGRESPSGRASDSARARPLVLFAALCLLATEATAPILAGLKGDRLQFDAENLAKSALDGWTLETLGELLPDVSPLAANGLSDPSTPEAAGAGEYPVVPTYLGPGGESTASREHRLVDLFFAADDAGSRAAASNPVTVTGTDDAPADEALPPAGNMMAAVYPPMPVAAPPSSGPSKDARVTDGRTSLPTLSPGKSAALGSAVRPDLRMPQPSSDAAGSPSNGLADHSGLATGTPGSAAQPLIPGVLDAAGITGNARLADHTELAHRTPGSATRPLTPGVLDLLTDSAAGIGGNLAVEDIVLATTTTNDLTASPQLTPQVTPFQVGPAVPEPTTLAFLAPGVVGLGLSLRKRQRWTFRRVARICAPARSRSR